MNSAEHNEDAAGLPSGESGRLPDASTDPVQKTDQLFASCPAWLSGDGPQQDVVLSSRVRLARNLAGIPFVNRASASDLRLVVESCKAVLLGAHIGRQTAWVDVEQANAMERALLLERHLISRMLARGKRADSTNKDPWPRGVAVALPGEQISVMVNEEDHIRLSVMRSGFALRDAWQQADAIDDALEAKIDFAFSPRLGYLTACPTNVGTGIRFSVMLHLPALRMTGEIGKVQRAAADMSLAVRGFYGEGSEATGDFYQLSNQTTLGRSEQQLLEEIETNIVPRVIEYEQLSREQLLAKRRWHLEDAVHRAFGVLAHARLLNTDEAIKLLSMLRLGVSVGLIDQMDIKTIHDLLLTIQPAHLQRRVNQKIGQDMRKRERARVVRESLAHTTRSR